VALLLSQQQWCYCLQRGGNRQLRRWNAQQWRDILTHCHEYSSLANGRKFLCPIYKANENKADH